MLYDFQCNQCGKIEEKQLKIAEIDNPVLCACSEKSEMTRIVSCAGLVFSGKWFKNAGEY